MPAFAEDSATAPGEPEVDRRTVLSHGVFDAATLGAAGLRVETDLRHAADPAGPPVGTIPVRSTISKSLIPEGRDRHPNR